MRIISSKFANFDANFTLKIWLGELDDVRNLQKAQSVARQIYQYFKSLIGRPLNDTER